MNKKDIFNIVKKEVLNNYDLVSIIKDINLHNGALSDLEFFEMEYFDEVMYGYSPTDIINMVYYGGKFNPNDKYFQFNGYGNLESFDTWEANKEAKEYINEIVETLIDNIYDIEALIDNIYDLETYEPLTKFIINLLENKENH